MWKNEYEPPESIFDSLEPVAWVVFIIALFAIIPFTPLSPFSERTPSALDQLAGVNVLATEVRVTDRDNAVSRVKQVDANVESAPVVR